MRSASPHSSLPHLTFLFLLSLLSFLRPALAQESTHPSIIEQTILSPTRDSVLTAGETFTIQWHADPHFANVTLEIWDKTSWGYSRDFGSLCYHWINPFCGTIVSHAPNTGSYEWNIPKPGSDFPRKERVFWIKMYVDDYLHPEIGNTDPVLSYSSNFCFAAEPGQQGETGPGESSTADVVSTVVSDVLLQSTVFVTVHDPASTGIATTTGMFRESATVMATSAPRINGTDLAPFKGGASKLGWSLQGWLLLLLGLL